MNDINFRIFTDGGCKGTNKPGGWAFLLRKLSDGSEIPCCGAEAHTTTNRMEMSAALHGIQLAQQLRLGDPFAAEIVSDSKYVVTGINQWMHSWAKYGWVKQNGCSVTNVDLWQPLHKLSVSNHISAIWVPGHTGHMHNEFCDRLASDAMETLIARKEEKLCLFEPRSVIDLDVCPSCGTQLQPNKPHP